MSLFGGSTKIDLLTGGQRKLLGDITDTLREQWGQAGPVYGGQVTPGLSPLQQQAVGMAGQLSPGVGGALSSMLSGVPDPAMIQDYYQRTVGAPAERQFQDMMRQAGQAFGDVYGTSGGFLRGMGGATSDFATNLAGQLAGLQFGERQQALDRQQAAIPLALGTQAQQMGQLTGLGGLQRGVEQQMNVEDLSKWTMAQPYSNPWVTGYLGPALNTQAFGYANEPGLLGQIGSFVGGLGSIGAGLAMGPAGLPLMGMGLGGMMGGAR